jgi:hypothetical protein
MNIMNVIRSFFKTFLKDYEKPNTGSSQIVKGKFAWGSPVHYFCCT